MARERCKNCSMFKFKGTACKCTGRGRRRGKDFIPEVDGTLGADAERRRGGPVYVPVTDGAMERAPLRREWVHLGEPYTAIPKGYTTEPKGED